MFTSVFIGKDQSHFLGKLWNIVKLQDLALTDVFQCQVFFTVCVISVINNNLINLN